MPSIAFKLITEKTEIVYKIAVNPFVNTNLAEIIIFIENRPIKALLDLGATKSVINGNLPCFSDFTRKNPIHPNSVTLQCADGNILPNDGLIDLMVKLNTFYSSQVNFIVSKYLSHNCILGTDFIESLNYSKDKPYVYLNGHKLRRYMPKIKPLIIRVSKDINLEPPVPFSDNVYLGVNQHDIDLPEQHIAGRQIFTDMINFEELRKLQSPETSPPVRA